MAPPYLTLRDIPYYRLRGVLSMQNRKGIQEHWNLSETDCKILLAFTEEMTSSDGLLIAGVRHDYGRSRISKLKARGYLQERRVGRDILLSCARRAELEFIWEQGLTKKATGKGFYFRFAGGQQTAGDSIVYMEQRFASIPWPRFGSLLEVMDKAIRALAVGSFKRSKGEISELMPKDILAKLNDHIKQAELELQFAKELRAHALIWQDSPTVWQSISFGQEPGEKSFKAYEELLNKKVRKVKQEAQPKQEQEFKLPGKLAPPGPNSHWREQEERERQMYNPNTDELEL